MSNTNNFDLWSYDDEKPGGRGGQPTLPTSKPTRRFRQTATSSTKHVILIISLVAVLALGCGWIASNSSAGSTLLHLLATSHRTVQITPPQKTPRPSLPRNGGNRQIPPPASTAFPQTLPPAWFASGHTAADAASASVIAQDFVLRYQSIDGSTLASLQAAQTSPTNFLTHNARLRYLGEMIGFPPDPHDTVAFARQFQVCSPTHQGIVSEQAIVDEPPQVQAESLPGVFAAAITVSYQLIVTSNGNKTQVSHQHMTLLLVPVAKNGLSAPNILGWGVTAYTDGTLPPQLPAQP